MFSKGTFIKRTNFEIIAGWAVHKILEIVTWLQNIPGFQHWNPNIGIKVCNASKTGKRKTWIVLSNKIIKIVAENTQGREKHTKIIDKY